MSDGGPLAAIHQPNFLPWLGYFDKVARADVFVLLDDAQFQKKGGTWTNRVQLLVGGEPSWATVPVDRGYSGHRLVNEMRINEQTPWREKLLRTIEMSYGRAPHYDEVIGRLGPLIGAPGNELAAYNERLIREVVAGLGLDRTRLVASSELDVDATATERLIELVRAVGATAYLSGGGAAGYQEEELFEAAGIDLVEQGFEHPEYPQPVEPMAQGLSVLDALMNVGFERTAELLGGKAER